MGNRLRKICHVFSCACVVACAVLVSLSSFAAAPTKQLVTTDCYWTPETTVNWNDAVANGGVIRPQGGTSVDVGKSLHLWVEPEAGWAVDHWRESSKSIYGTDTTCGTVMDGSEGKTNLVWTVEGTANVYLAVKFRYLTYALEEAGGRTLSEIVYTNEINLSGAPASVPVGYHFGSWTNVANGAESFAAGASVTGRDFDELSNVHVDGHTVRLAPRWVPNVYDLAYELNGGAWTNGFVAPASAAYDTVFSLAAPARDGYDFAGWKVTQNLDTATARWGMTDTPSSSLTAETLCVNGDRSVFFKNLNPTAGVTVTLAAQWVRRYVVTFYENSLFKDLAPYPDGVIRRVSVSAGGTAERPGDPSHPGYQFAGWSGTYVNVQRDESVFATYEANSYRVVFHANDGSGRTTDEPFRYGEAKALLPNPLPRTGYVLKGWATSPESATVVYQDGQTVSNLATEGAVNLYAVWGPIRYSLDFVAGGGSGTMDGTNLAYGATYVLPDCSFIPPKGGLFKDWSLTVAGVVTNLPAGAVVSNLTTEADATLTAVATWRGFYAIAFDGNGSDPGTMTNCVVEENVAFQLPSNEFVRVNFHFGGWATNAAETVRHADGAVVTNLAAPGETCTLFASWLTNRCTVVFHPNPPPKVSMAGCMADQVLVYGQGQRLNRCAYSCGELWSFVGWSNTVNGAVYADEQAPDDLFGKDDATIGLNALWKSVLTDLSLAMGCHNLIWSNTTSSATAGWKVGVWLETADACAESFGNGAYLSTSVRTNGTLRFEWHATGRRQTVLLKRNGDEMIEEIILNNLSGAAAAGSAKVEIQLRPGETFRRIEILARDIDGVDSVCQIRNMTWTPEGLYPAPTQQDAATISSAAVVDGRFVLSFAATNVFDYVLRTNADLRVDSWGEMQKTNGAETVTFEPPILPGLPQLFYKVETVQKK